jgi:hypothetical protein
VVFAPKTYRFARQDGGAILSIEGADGITLDGHGAEIIGNPWNGFLSIRNSRNNPLFPALRSSPTAFSGASRKKQIPSSGGRYLMVALADINVLLARFDRKHPNHGRVNRFSSKKKSKP